METIAQPKFKNEAEPRELSTGHRHPYGFTVVPKLLFVWSGLFQKVISQTGTYLMTGRFHERQSSIYKTEGGCVIDGIGDLVLGDSSCYFDHDSKDATPLSNLITDIVLAWNPNEPVDSMLEAAGKHLFENCPSQWTRYDYEGTKRVKKVHRRPKQTAEQFTDELKKALENNKRDSGGPFGGNALADFFDWNPFSKAPINREYERYCLVRFDNKTEADVDQLYADQDQGEEFLKKINEVIKNGREGFPRYSHAYCCRPDRHSGELQFWINTGGSSPIDGWKNAQEIDAFLKG